MGFSFEAEDRTKCPVACYAMCAVHRRDFYFYIFFICFGFVFNQ